MTTVASESRVAGSEPAQSDPPDGDLPLTPRSRRWLGYALLAVFAYVPALLTHPGKVEADTKTYLYLDPGRLLSAAGSMWDPNIGLGTVSHQTIGYLFPLGPFYWLLEQGLGMPSWVAERLWLGTLIFAAGLGMRFMLKTIGMRGPGVPVAVLAFAFTPYVLQYSARFSVILGPWAALPWMIAVVVLALRRGGWMYPAMFALIVQAVGGVNATALIFAGLGPVLWIPYSVWVLKESTVRRACSVVLRIGLLTLATSLWWMAGLWAQGGYGIDVLRFTETLETVSYTSYANEVLRGLGYWFFYGQDKVGPWNASAYDYTQLPWLILVSYGIPALALLSAALVRWRHRAFFILLALLGVVIAVGASPFDNPSVLGGLFKDFAETSTAGLALRSTARAVPLMALGFAALLGAGATAVCDRLTVRGMKWVGFTAAGVLMALLLVNSPGVWHERYYSKQLERPEEVPKYWQSALKYVNEQPHTTRVLALPGSDFASYRWGSTIDPIEPGLIDRPYVARELIPWGSAPSATLLQALDRRIHEGVLDPEALAPVSRLMSVGDVLLRMDLQTDRYNLIRSSLLWRLFSPEPPAGLDAPRTFGTKIPGKARYPQIDEQALSSPTNEKAPPPVAVFKVQDSPKIVRTQPTGAPLVVDGDAEGLVDVASIGLLDANHIVLYSPSQAKDPEKMRSQLADGATLIVTDTNRKRAQRWATVRDNYGYTEQAGETPLAKDEADQRLEVFPGSGDDARTVTVMNGVKSVQASRYGNAVFGYATEERASFAVDDDVRTAWKVGGALGKVVGERIRIVLDHPITTDHVNLVQPLYGPRGRWISQVSLTFDGGHTVVRPLGPASRAESGDGQVLRFPKRTFSSFEVTIDDLRAYQGIGGLGSPKTGKASEVGFAEIRLQDAAPGSTPVHVDEVVRMPKDLLAAAGKTSLQHPLALTMTRDRQSGNPRSDAELGIARSFTLPTARAFAFAGTARLNIDAPDDVLDERLGVRGPGTSTVSVSTPAAFPHRQSIRARGSAAIDGDLSTAWNTQFDAVKEQWIKVEVPSPITVDGLDLHLVADGRHSLPTVVTVASDDGTSRTVSVPNITDQPTENATVSAPITFEPLTGTSFTVTIDDIRPVTTLDFGTEKKIAMPVGIAELGLDGVRVPAAPAQLASTCVDDLLTVDGTPVPVRITGSTATAESRGPLTVTLCNPDALQLAAGEHVLRTVHGIDSGFDFDRIVLSSAPGGTATPVASLTATSSAKAGTAPAMKLVKQGKTSMTARVERADKPFWIVLGQSDNAGWVAKANGKDLGDSQLVDGYANGWLVKPSGDGPITITIEWVPQNTVRIAVWLSVVAALLCIGIIAVGLIRRRQRRAAMAAAPLVGTIEPELVSPFVAGGRTPRPLVIAATTILAGAAAAVIVRPWVGLLTGVLVLLVLLVPKTRAVLALVPTVALMLCGLFVAVSQFRHSYPPQFEWPTGFWRVRNLGWLAIILLAADAVVGLARRAEPEPVGALDVEPSAPEDPDPEPADATV